MNGLHEHRSLACFDANVAECSHRHSTTGIELVQQAFGLLLAQLLVNHEKHVRLDGLQLKVCSVFDSTVALGFFGAAAFQGVTDQATTLGQRLVRTGGDFANRDTAVFFITGLPSNDVAAVGDVDLCLVLGSFDSPRLMNRVQLRME